LRLVLPVALIFTTQVVNQIADEVVQSPGFETGGLLFGPTGSVATRNVWVPNDAADPARGFSIDPQLQAETIIYWQERGLDFIGSYHSHPSGNPAMSNTDAATAETTGQLLIVAPGASWEWRLYDPVARAEAAFRIAPPHQYREVGDSRSP
jgi:proteasome lid subunit RPN8/RPN11